MINYESQRERRESEMKKKTIGESRIRGREKEKANKEREGRERELMI
jgi:hypothetical protein